MSLDIIKIRALDANMPYQRIQFVLEGPFSSEIRLAFIESDKEICDTISINLVLENMGSEILDITKKGRRGHERFEVWSGPESFNSLLLGENVNLEDKIKPIKLTPDQRNHLAGLLWAAHTVTSDEIASEDPKELFDPFENNEPTPIPPVFHF